MLGGQFHHSLRSSLDLGNRLRATQGKHGHDGLFRTSEGESFVERMSKLVNPASRSGMDEAHQSMLGAKFAERVGYFALGAVHDRLAIRRLIHRGHDAVE